MILTIVINGGMAFAIILVMLYTMGNPDGVLDASYPIIPICINATGSRPAANAMVSGLIIVTYCVVAASVASVSRITWAWARDGALPKYFAIVRTAGAVNYRPYTDTTPDRCEASCAYQCTVAANSYSHAACSAQHRIHRGHGLQRLHSPVVPRVIHLLYHRDKLHFARSLERSPQ